MEITASDMKTRTHVTRQKNAVSTIQNFSYIYKTSLVSICSASVHENDISRPNVTLQNTVHISAQHMHYSGTTHYVYNIIHEFRLQY